jgi:lactoylglutathione lyase
MDPRFTHVRLLVEDVSACFVFYRDVMGFEPLFVDEDGYCASVKTGATTLSINRRSGFLETLGPVGWLATGAVAGDRMALIFAVEDVDRAWTELGKRGAEFVTRPADRPHWGIRTAHLRDPDGNLIEINQPL